jgi:YD repeat-containing protein
VDGERAAQTAQDAESRVTRYDYNQTYADEAIKVTADYGRLNLITQYGYDAYGDANSVTDANVKTTTSVFDALRRVTEADAPIAGVKTTWTYFPDGQVHTVTRNSGTPETTTYSYTVSDKVSSVADALCNTTTTTYDSDDRVQTVTQQVTATQNRQRTSSYDALSRIYQVSDTTAGSPGQVLETHAYTPNGRELSFTDANNHAITWTYDGLDRLSQTNYPDGSTLTNSQFDANGNVTLATTRSGQTIGFTYDALNRAATKNPQGETAGQVSYGYDALNRLTEDR